MPVPAWRRRLGELVGSFVVETTPAAQPARVDLHENSIVLVAESAHHRGDTPSVDELLNMLTRGLRVVETGARKRGRRSPQVMLVTDPGDLLTGLVFFDADNDCRKVQNVSASTATLSAGNER
jgi:hypothetical protein